MIKEAHNLDNILKEHAVDLADKMHQYINLHEYDNFRTERTQEEIDALFTKIKEDLLKGDTDAYIKYMYKASNSKIGGKSEPIGFLDRIYELNVLHDLGLNNQTLLEGNKLRTSELAYELERNYIAIYECEEGYDYNIYDKQYNLIDGGLYEDMEINIHDTLDLIMKDEWGISLEDKKNIEELNYDVFTDLVDNIESVKLEEKIAKFEGRNGEVTELLDIIMHPGELKENNLDVATEKGNYMELELYGTKGLSFEDMKLGNMLPEDLDKEDLLDKYFSGDYESIKEVTVGYDNSEDKYKGYKEEYSPTMAEYIEFDNLPGQHIIATNNQYEGIQFTFHYSKEFAEQVLNNMVGTGEISIEDEIEQFKEKLEKADIDTYGIKVSVQPEYNNGGNFYSYQVENFDSLLLDNCFNLNDEKVKECALMIETLGKEIEGFHIESIAKGTKPYGFNKYYEMIFKKGDFEIVDEVIINPLVFAQGQERNTLDVILEGVDFDWLNDEYTIWRNEQPDYDEKLSELKEATENLEKCNQMDKDMLEELAIPMKKDKAR